MNKQKIISVAPMMDWTDRHCRYFHRLIAPSILLYTEMVTTGAILFGNDRDRFLGFDDAEHPVALQLGGSDPVALAECAKIGEDYGYDEINLNCGCPSDRVQSGMFGACLMKNPELVAKCIKAMQDVVKIPVTVKCRIGIDDCEDYEFLENFIRIVSEKGGCKIFIIHARKAWLQGLSPKENRDIPPLQYDLVADIQAAFPHLTFHINGGIKTMEQVSTMLGLPSRPSSSGNGETKSQADFNFDGVMIGREAYQNPWFLRHIEEELSKSTSGAQAHDKNASGAQARYGGTNAPAALLSAEEIIHAMIPYIKDQQQRFDTPIKSITRHMTGLFSGQPGARQWRQILSTEVHKDNVTPEILIKAMEQAFPK
jgi:tRNA-dihydrouridine synthase A